MVEHDAAMGQVLHMIVDSKYPKTSQAQRVYPTKWIASNAERGLPLQPPYSFRFRARFNEKSLGLDAPNVVFSLFNKHKNESGSYNTFNLRLRLDPNDGKNRFIVAPRSSSGNERWQWIKDFEVRAGEIYDISIAVSREARVYVEFNGRFATSALMFDPKDSTLGGFHTGAYAAYGSLPDGAAQWYTPVEILSGAK